MSRKQEIKRNNRIRWIALIAFLALFSIFSIRHFVLGGGVAASVDALCPFGGFETLFTFISTGGFVPRILMSSLILAAGVLLTVLIMRRGFCGYICPFGAVQEIAGKISKKKITVPRKADHYFRYLKYLILAGILVGTAILGTLVWRSYDPFVTFFHFGKGIFWDYSADEFVSALIPFIMTIIILGFSVFIDRFFCRYLCPLGAMMNIFTLLGLAKIKRDTKTCNSCGICDKSCPMGVEISDKEEIKSVECINCNICVNRCPKSSLGIRMSKWNLSIPVYAVSVIALLFLVIGASEVIGIWNSIPGTTLTGAGGELDADSIKGWMTFRQVSDETGIDSYCFINHMGLPADINIDMPLKDISAEYGIDLHAEDVREFVKDYQEIHEQELEAMSGNAVAGIAEDSKVACPWGIHDDPYPGQCGLYTDQDGNKICDLSE